MGWHKILILSLVAGMLLNSCGQAVRTTVPTAAPQTDAETIAASPTVEQTRPAAYPTDPPAAATLMPDPVSPTETPSTDPTYTLTPWLTTTVTSAPGYTPPVSKGQILLPEPLYYLYPPDWDNPDTQIWRLEPDGQTVTQITHEVKRVRTLDVARDGRLAYISENDLIVTDAKGGSRKVLIAGGAYPQMRTAEDTANNLKNAVDNPLWSPDGRSLAVGWNGVKLIDPQTGSQIQVSPENQYLNRVVSYNPVAWTPSGSRILIWIGFYEDGALATARPQAKSQVWQLGVSAITPSSDQFAFLKDGRLLFGASEAKWQVKPDSIWIADPQTASGNQAAITQVKLKPDKQGSEYVIKAPWQAADGRIYFFFYPSNTSEKTFAQLGWANLAPAEEKRNIHPITSFGFDSHLIDRALWAPDGSLAVIPVYQGKLVVIRTSDGATFLLDVPVGADLHWGNQ